MQGLGSPAAEAYRTLRTWLCFSYRASSLPSLLITSPQRCTDQVNLVANLGAAMAQAGLKTVLVDADLRKAGLHLALGAPARPGLDALLSGTDDLDAYVVETSVPGLHLLPGGSPPSDPLGLLSSLRMAWLFRQLEERYDLVLIHGPPILAAADALVLAAQVTGTMLLISSRSTRRKAAMRALALLDNIEAHILGAVLTQARTASSKEGSCPDFGKPAPGSLARRGLDGLDEACRDSSLTLAGPFTESVELVADRYGGVDHVC